MRVHFSSIAAFAAALLFVSGTVGCRSNGGDWYKPTTYSWYNPFTQESPATTRPSDAFANTKKPSLDSHPNVSTPQGGYSDGSSLANRSTPQQTGTSGGYAPDSWGQQNMGQQNMAASHTPPSHLSGYTLAETSPYPPPYITSGPATGGQQMQQMAQQNSMPYGPSDYVQTVYHQPGYPGNPGVYQQQQQPTQQVPPGTYGGMEQPGQYAPFGVMPNDPYAAIQQPVTVPAAGVGFEQQQPPAQAYPPQGGFY